MQFCYRVGMDYVSCSPFRVPIARLAAALNRKRFVGPSSANSVGVIFTPAPLKSFGLYADLISVHIRSRSRWVAGSSVRGHSPRSNTSRGG